MTDKDNINDDKFMRVVKGEEPLKDRPHIKSRDNDDGIIATHGKDKTSKVAQMIKDLDKTIKEESEDMPVEILVEKDEFGKTKFIIREKVKDLEESNQTEFKELTESFEEARFEEGDNTIRNVCVLTSISKNNRVYKESAMANVLSLVNGTKCYCDHSLEKGKIRSVRDLIGQLKNPHKVGNKIYADLQVLSNKVEFIMPLAKEMPHQIGMSIVAQGKIGGRDEKGRMQVEEVVSLRSCDIVVDPATVNSLFEQKIGVKKDGSIGQVKVGKKFDPKSPVCEFCHKVTCPVYSELNVNYEKCLLYKDGENCPYSEGGEFYRKKTSEKISDEDFVNKVKE